MPLKDPIALKTYLAAWHLENAERRNLAAKARYRKSPAQAKNTWLLANFGITLADYNNLLIAQSGVCAICARPEHRLHRGKPRALAVDHNHETGKVRALLCGDCNIALGLFEEQPDRLTLAAQYLVQHA